MASELRLAAPPRALLLPTTSSDDAPQQLLEPAAGTGRCLWPQPNAPGAQPVGGGSTPNTAYAHGADDQATTTSAFDAVCATATSTLDAPPLALASALAHIQRCAACTRHSGNYPGRP